MSTTNTATTNIKSKPNIDGASSGEKQQAPSSMEHGTWYAPWFDDMNAPLPVQSVCTRILCAPCQTLHSCLHACSIGECGAIMSIFCCCPCRTCCGYFPASFESVPTEPEVFPYEAAHEDKNNNKSSSLEITYDRIFEMERKKRQLLKAETH